jgi:hypothetical protein
VTAISDAAHVLSLAGTEVLMFADASEALVFG